MARDCHPDLTIQVKNSASNNRMTARVGKKWPSQVTDCPLLCARPE